MTDANPTLFFSPGACSFGAIVALEWANLPYNLCKVVKADRQTDAYKKINMLGQVPAFKTGDRVLTENVAILKHIAGLVQEKNLDFKAGTPEADMMNMILSYYSSNFHPAFHPYFAAQRFHDDEKVQAEIKEKSKLNIRKKYEFVEKCFEGHDMHFKAPTIADAYFYGLGRWGTNTGILDVKKEFPNIGRFMNKMEADPAVQFALAIEKDEAGAKTTGKFQGSVKLEDVKAPVCKAA